MRREVTERGWGLFIYAELHGAAQNQKARQQISQLSTSEESFKTQLAQQQQASGSLADLQTRIAAATDRARQATAARDQAQAELASVQKELEAQRQQQAQVVQQLQAQTQQLSQVQGQMQETEQHLAAARNEIATNQQAMVARSQELADVGKRLEAARQ